MSGSNRWAGGAFRDNVVDYLRSNGLENARRSKPTAVLPSAQLREDLPDVMGVPNLALMVRTRGEDRSSPLILSRSSADTHGLSLYGYVLQRRGREVGESYFTTDLACLLRMLDLMNA